MVVLIGPEQVRRHLPSSGALTGSLATPGFRREAPALNSRLRIWWISAQASRSAFSVSGVIGGEPRGISASGYERTDDLEVLTSWCGGTLPPYVPDRAVSR